MHIIKPRTNLSNIFRNKISRIILFQPTLILKRIMLRTIRHAAGFKPAIQNLRNTRNRLLTLRTRHLNLINNMLMQVQIIRNLRRSKLLQISNRTYNYNFLTVQTFPHRNRRSPETITRNRPIRSSLQNIPETTILHMVTILMNQLITSKQTLLHLLNINKPRINSIVKQRRLAPRGLLVYLCDENSHTNSKV